MPGAGGSQRLVRVLGKYLASQLLMGGGMLDAARAHALGLVCELVEPGEAAAAATALAHRLAAQPPLALAAIKRSLAAGADLPLADANALEQHEFLRLFDTADQKEGMVAFLAKRKPAFEGR
jgi:enoyl-CoA hydratase/carnithine racemase